MRSEDFRADKARPFTGAEYLESLRDGREVYINGERVECAHPAVMAVLAHNHEIALEDLGDALDDPAVLAQIAGLVNAGYWYFSAE